MIDDEGEFLRDGDDGGENLARVEMGQMGTVNFFQNRGDCLQDNCVSIMAFLRLHGIRESQLSSLTQ